MYLNQLLPVIISLWLIGVKGQNPTVPVTGTCSSPNEEFAVDIYRCQNTCGFYGRSGLQYQCDSYKPYGDCYCKDGFARLKDGGACVSVKNNANCRAQLPITSEQCTGVNEEFVETLFLPYNNANSDATCLTFGLICNRGYNGFGPHCACKNGFLRLSNGICVASTDPQCVAEYQPSPKRCKAIGQIYTVNAPCQNACTGFGDQYCPPPGGTCICPIGKIMRYANDQYNCVYPGNCQQVCG